MRLSHNCLVVLLLFFLEAALSYDKCYNEFCVMKGKSCKDHEKTRPFEIIVDPNPCEYELQGTIKPGEYRAVCCDSEESKQQKMELLALKNKARALAGASPNEYPHQVAFKAGAGSCGGTVYNKDWIITASHCVQVDGVRHVQKTGVVPSTGKQAFVIAGQSHIAGPPDYSKYFIDKVITHPNWNQSDIEKGNDIALLHLSRPLKMELGKIQPLRLEAADHNPVYGGKGFLIGYGNVNEKMGNATDDLMEFVAPIHSNAKAAALSTHPQNASGGGTAPSRNHLSVGGDDSGVVVGKGDSGGPFICPDANNKPVLCGIASFKTCEPFMMCKRPNYYLRVAPYLDFIKKETRNAGQEEEFIFDKTMFPEQIPEPEAPSYLVRIAGPQRSCMGTLVSPRMALTSAECFKANGGDTQFRPVVYHFKTGKGLAVFNKHSGFNFTRDISPSFSKHMKQNLNKFDIAAVNLREPVEAEFPELAPLGYELKGEADEYSFNPLTNSLEKRHFVSLTEFDCSKRIEGIDKNVKFDFKEQLCMRQVYSAEAVCERDIGGPLMCEGGKYICGIKTFQACKYPGMPEIFERTAGEVNKDNINYLFSRSPT